MKKAIYTVITNNYDTLKEPLVITPGWDYIAFIDKNTKAPQNTVWQIRHIEDHAGLHPFSNPSLTQRWFKIHHHKALPEYKITCYIDGSTQMVRDISGIFSYFQGGMMLKRHLLRDCIYAEGEACISLGKDKYDIIQNQLHQYAVKGMPIRYGLYETGFIIRSNNKQINEIMEEWYREIAVHSIRDQVSLPYILWKYRYNPHAVHYSLVHQYIKVHPHRRIGFNIWHSTPGRGDKNIGKAYNDFMQMIPDGDWVCLRDGDSMFMTDHWSKQIEDIIEHNGENYALIGCKTNRLRTGEQLLNGEPWGETNLLEHRRVAEQLLGSYNSTVTTVQKPIAGLCMIFNKDTWKSAGKFKEKSIYCDTEFGYAVQRNGGMIGIAQGLYLLHYYRLHKSIDDKTHLL